ncbi:MAG: gas vesicle protein K [Pirellula sp.]|nr:gas vesicle protein K [Pirellula sp.]
MSCAHATKDKNADAELAEAMMASAAESRRVELNAENAANGLGRLAVTIVNLLHELLERQAIRRMENGTLTDEEIERVGDCLMKQSEAIDSLCQAFGIGRDDLNMDLGPLGKLL